MPAQAPKARSKESKLEGARPGWVFKTGERGLGYYPDAGWHRSTISLELAVWHTRDILPMPIMLNELVAAEPTVEARPEQ